MVGSGTKHGRRIINWTPAARRSPAVSEDVALSIGTARTVLALGLIGVAATVAAQTLPSRVLRPEPVRVLVRYSDALTPDDSTDVALITSMGFYSDVEAAVTPDEVVVTLSSEDSGALEALGRMDPPGAAFLIIEALTLGGRIHRNLIAQVPVTPEVRLDGDVWYETWLNVDYLPPAHRDRSLRPEAWVVDIEDRPFPVSRVEPWPSEVDETEAMSNEDPILLLTLDGRIPYGARATVSFRERSDAEPLLLTSGTTPDAPPGPLANFIRDLNVYTGFMFTSSARTDPTFGLVTRFRRPYRFAALGPRNQVSIGPRASLITNSSDQDDENSLLLSAPVTFRRFRGPLSPRPGAEAPLFNTVVFDIGPTLESERSFRNRNLVSDAQLTLHFSTLGRADLKGALSGYALDVRPHMGFEAGRSLGSSSRERVAKSIARLKAGVTGQFRLEFERPQLRAIVFDVDYVYRRLYTDEAFGSWFTTPESPETGMTGDGVATNIRFVRRELLTGTGQHPRRYLNVAIRFVFSRYWEIFASYIRGELPPSFVRVDKTQAGFAFRLGTP